jgi:hypothetical protein
MDSPSKWHTDYTYMQGEYDCVQYFELVICYPILIVIPGPDSIKLKAVV